jgi:hypothetical protein
MMTADAYADGAGSQVGTVEKPTSHEWSWLSSDTRQRQTTKKECDMSMDDDIIA